MDSPPVSARASVSRRRDEIAQLLQGLLRSGGKVVCFLNRGELLFESHLMHVDPGARYIVLEPAGSEAANKALLAQRRCILSASVDGWRLEFVAAGPKLAAAASSETARAIRLDFPEVMTRWQRAHDRAPVSPGVPLQCVADFGGITPFEALVVDIGPEGLGFLIHSENITLEPGTLLKSCIIEVPGGKACKADLEVCYSQRVVLGDGTRSVRSGCRFVQQTDAVRELIRFYVSRLGR